MILILLFLITSLESKATDYQKMPHEKVRLMIGETLKIKDQLYTVKLKGFYQTPCAIPGQNCGAGYTPHPQPQIEFSCQGFCSYLYDVTDTDSKTYIEVSIYPRIDICLTPERPGYRTKDECISGVAQQLKDFKYCERIEHPEIKDECYERFIQDGESICDKVKKPSLGCVEVKAIKTKNISICDSARTPLIKRCKENYLKRFIQPK